MRQLKCILSFFFYHTGKLAQLKVKIVDFKSINPILIKFISFE